MDTMAKRKVNSYCEFPLTLDLYPFSEAGLAGAAAPGGAGSPDGPVAPAEVDCSVHAGPDVAGDTRGLAPTTTTTTTTVATAAGGLDASALAQDFQVEGSTGGAGGAGVVAGLSEATGALAEAGPCGAPGLASPASAQRAQWLYTLSGVVIHSGTSEAGHYFSFIKDPGSGGWLEFNDHTVRPFHLGSIEAEAFGGEDQDRAAGADGDMGPQLPRQRTQSAYMLVYQRVPPPGVGLQRGRADCAAGIAARVGLSVCVAFLCAVACAREHVCMWGCEFCFSVSSGARIPRFFRHARGLWSS